MERRRAHRRWATILAAVTVAVVAGFWGHSALTVAQEPDAEDGVYFPPDRPLMQRLSAAEELLKDERYSEAVRLLGSILESPQDFFFQPDPEARVFRSLKSEAQRLLGALPRAGRESYQLQYGNDAQRLLAAAAAAGDVDGLAEVSRRFFHTDAGYEATELLGTIHMREGRPLAAALCFKRLAENESAARAYEPELSIKLALCWARAGMNGEALETLARLEKQSPGASIEIAGKEHKLSGQSDRAAAWLASLSTAPLKSEQQDWLMHRGGPARVSVSAGSAPLLDRRWAVPTINDPRWENEIESGRLSLTEQGVACLPSAQPLAVDGFIFMRSLTGLVAVDSQTGKRVWHGPTDEPVRQLFESRTSSPSDSQLLVARLIEQRVWDDAPFGMMSSDGERVFCIEGLGLAGLDINSRMVFPANGNPFGENHGTSPSNRLAAYEIATEGKLAWDIGAGGSSTDPELREAFFLGPPLVLSDRLYVLAEIRGEVRLLALDARSGQLDWSQQLAVLEQTIADDPTRRMAGAMPSYSDGVLVCPTSAGAVVGVDLTTRSLLWGYQYGRSQDPRALRIAAIQMGATPSANEDERWLDASVTIADGRVLLTPPESNELHCLDLLDGKLMWKQPRSDGLYAACVHDGAVVVVGRGHMRAYRLSDGEAAWTTAAPRLPSGVYPAGRGFFNGRDYFLPLTSGEVARVDISTGRIVDQARSRDGEICGNLICYQGSIISQSGSMLESFFQVDDLRHEVETRLAANANDASALALEGELLLNDGKVGDAVDRLRKSLSLERDPRTRELLVQALVEGLRADFPTYRQDADEIESLIETPGQRLAYLREMATGLQHANDIQGAFAAYLAIADLDQAGGEGDTLERIDSLLAVRRDRWIQARLAELQAGADGDDVASIEKLIRQRLTAAEASEKIEPLNEFLERFAFHPLADEARKTLVKRWPTGREPLALERLLRQLERSNDPQTQREATARLAMSLAEHRYDDARPYIQQLEEWGKLTCLDGRTGGEIAKSLASRQPVAPNNAWPSGNIEIEELPGQQNPTYRSYAIDLRGPRGPFYQDKSIEMDQSKQLIVGRDGLGRVLWRVNASDRGDRMAAMGFNPTLSHASIDGHLVLVSMGFELLAIDTLGSDGQGPSVLWRESLIDSPSGTRHVGIHGRVVNMPWGMQRFVASDTLGRPIGTIGPLTPNLVCFQRSRTLVAVDPLTGKTLWTRHGLQPGCELMGDDELLFVTEPNSSKALVLSTRDGRELGRRKMPPTEERLLTRGREVVTWRLSGGRAVAALRDLWSEEQIWRKDFDVTAKPWPIENEAIAVFERRGNFVILDAADGSAQLEATLDPEPSLTDIYVLRNADRDLLIVNRPLRNSSGVNVQPVPGGFGNPMINGAVYGFDRATGTLLFTTPIDGRSLTFNQPSQLPLLMFAAQVYRQNRSSRANNAPEAMILCIDKRDGRVVYDEKTLGPIAGVELTGNDEHDEIVLRTLRTAVRLKFTDKPIQPLKKKAQPDDESPDKAKGEKS